MVSGGSAGDISWVLRKFNMVVSNKHDIAIEMLCAGGALDDIFELFGGNGAGKGGEDGVAFAQAPEVVKPIAIDQADHLIGEDGIEDGPQLAKGDVGFSQAADPAVDFFKPLVGEHEGARIQGRIGCGPAEGGQGGIVSSGQYASVAESPDQLGLVNIPIEGIGGDKVNS